MGLLNWFKALASGKDVPPLPRKTAPKSDTPADDPDSGRIAGFDFMDAFDAHMAWKVRLEKCIANNNQEGLKVDVVGRDDQCVLGKWIHGAGGQQFGHLREFQEMKMEHIRFHLAAADVLACYMAGDKDGAIAKLESGEYLRATTRLKLHLSRLYVQLTEQSKGT